MFPYALNEGLVDLDNSTILLGRKKELSELISFTFVDNWVHRDDLYGTLYHRLVRSVRSLLGSIQLSQFCLLNLQ